MLNYLLSCFSTIFKIAVDFAWMLLIIRNKKNIIADDKDYGVYRYYTLIGLMIVLSIIKIIEWME